MSSYIGRHAELYDIFYNNKPYQEEAKFVECCLRQYANKEVKNILELACGTGTHAIELANFGYNITATDYSSSMLEVARKKNSEKSLPNIDFYLKDMRELDYKNNTFDAVICLFDSIGYNLTNEGIKQTLTGVYQSLCPGGLFIFEFWHAAAMLRYYDPLRVRRWQIPNGEILRISETSLDCIRQIAKVNYTIYEFFNNGSYQKLHETQENRFFFIQEMDSFLNQSGFMPLKWFSGYSFSEKISEETWHVLVIAEKFV